MARYCGVALDSFRRQLPVQLIIDGKFAERGLKPRKGVYVDDDATRLDLLVAGVGMAIFQRADAMQAVDAGQAVIWPTESIEFDLVCLSGRAQRRPTD